MKKYAKRICIILSKMILYVVWLFPHKKRVFFYADQGLRDNIGVLYHYMIKNNFQEHYEIICAFEKNQDIPRQTVANVIFTSKIPGIIYFFISQYAFYSFGFYPVKPCEKQMVVNLWHGMPLKAIGYLEHGRKHEMLNCFSKLLVTGDCFIEMMQKAFGCSENQILKNGQPKSDLLYTPLKPGLSDLRKQYKKVILWLPTFRSSMLIPYDNTTDSISMDCMRNDESATERFSKLNCFLSRYNVLLILKNHPIQNIKGSCHNITNYSNIARAYQLGVTNEYELMKVSDALITDYSSISFDYMLLDRPIGYIIDDFEEYRRERGFMMEEALDYMPGKKIYNYGDIVQFVKECMEGSDSFREKRNQMSKRINQYVEQDNSHALLKQIGII